MMEACGAPTLHYVRRDQHTTRWLRLSARTLALGKEKRTSEGPQTSTQRASGCSTSPALRPQANDFDSLALSKRESFQSQNVSPTTKHESSACGGNNNLHGKKRRSCPGLHLPGPVVCHTPHVHTLLAQYLPKPRGGPVPAGNIRPNACAAADHCAMIAAPEPAVR
jgi:hypothetical protein